MSKIGCARVLINLIRDPDQIEVLYTDVFALDFVFAFSRNAEFFQEQLSDLQYEHLEDLLKGLPEGIYEVFGDFAYHAWESFNGEYNEWDEEWEIEEPHIRALTPEDLEAYQDVIKGR